MIAGRQLEKNCDTSCLKIGRDCLQKRNLTVILI